MRNRRLNALAGTLLGVCCLSIALVAAPSWYGEAPQPESEPSVSSNHVGESRTAHGGGESIGDTAPAGELFSIDPLASYEEGVVLATLTPGTSAEQAAGQLAGDALLAGSTFDNVTDDLVKVALPASVSVEEAVNALVGKSAFADAQPNYEYFAVEDVMSSASMAPSLQPEASAATVEPLSFGESPVLNIDESPLLGVQSNLSVPPNDKYYDVQSTYLSSIRIEGAWTLTNPPDAGEEVVIAVLDQGFDTTHAKGDLDSSVFVYPYNSDTKTEGISALSGFESHGTHVASVICATTNNNTGIAGTAYNMCKVMPIKVANSQGKMYSDGLANAYKYLIQKRGEGVNVRVANVSLGSPRANQSYTDLDRSLYSIIHNAEEAGVLTVAAACNTDEDFPTAPFYALPSDFDNVVSVIGLKRAGTRYETSNYNMPGQRAKNISAPATGFDKDTYGNETGVIVLGAKSQGESDYQQAYGTSLATPLVSTAAALMLTANPSLTPAQVTSKLYSTVVDVTNYGSGWDAETGYGRLDVSKAVAAAEPYIDGPTVTYAETPATYSVLANGTQQSGYKFTSSDSDVAEITADGVLTPKTGGVATITAKGGNKSAVQSVTVYDNLSNAKIDGADTVLAGTTSSYAVDASPLFTWLWTSSDSSIAPIYRQTGLLSPPRFAAGADKTVTITATLASDSSVSTTKDIAITSNDISEGNPHVTATASSTTYNGHAQSPTVTVKYDDTTLRYGTDYTVDALPSEVNAGTYTLTVKGIGSYDGERTLDFVIGKSSIDSANVVLDETVFIYDGNPKAPTVSIFDVGENAAIKLSAGVDYAVNSAPITFGEGKVEITASQACKNFTGSVTCAFKVITNKDISESNPSISAEITSTPTYNGQPRVPTIVLKHEGTTLVQGADYEIIETGNNVNAYIGSSAAEAPYAKLKGIGSYDGERTVTFTINKASINTASIRLSATSFVYDGKAKSPSVAVYDIGSNASVALANGTDYVLVTSAATLGTGKVVVTAKDACRNFTGSATRTFTVDARRVPMYRLYNPNSGEHFYTAAAGERDHLRQVGWSYENIGWTAPHASSSPVFRLYNAHAGDHHYTQSASERDFLVSVGWSYEGVGWYSDTLKRQPIYREYNPYAKVGTHNYTPLYDEHAHLCSIGWNDEGIGWYGV